MSDPRFFDDYPAIQSQILDGEHRLKHEVVALAEGFGEVSAESASAFLRAFSAGSNGDSAHHILALPSNDEFDTWVRLGREILERSPAASELCREYFSSSSPFLSARTREDLPGTFRHLEGWVELGLEIGERSHGAAIEFFRSTPAFLETGKMHEMRQWAAEAIQILAASEARDKAAIAYLKSSPRMHQFLAVIGFKEWKALGLLMAKHSGDLANAYFALWPDGFESLHQNDVRNILNVSALIARLSPEKASGFYEHASRVMARLNPSVRESLLKTALTIASNQGERVMGTFDDIASALLPLSNPAQESVMMLEAGIGEVSIKAASAYFNAVVSVVSEISEGFLPRWVEKGLSFLREDEQKGIDYFSIDTKESREEVLKWKEAVLLDDHKKVLTIFAQALTGKELRLKSMDELEVEEEVRARRHAAADGETIYLPPWFAEEDSRGANFTLYKVATAHHAGYVEYGTFAVGLPALRSFFDAFPNRALAKDIFFIIEDGRIDRRLKTEYAGLAVEIDGALSRAMKRRPFPQDDPLAEGLEVLLRLSVDFYDEGEVSPGILPYARRMKRTLAEFYEGARQVTDTMVKTTEVYQALSEFAATGVYRRILPLPFRERPDLDILPGLSLPSGVPDEIEEVDQRRSLVSIPLSPEELKNLLEKLKDLQLQNDLEEDAESQGLYVTGSGIEAEESTRDPNAEDPENRGQPIRLGVSHTANQDGPFYYDEWDHLQGAYRRRWCCLRQERVSPRGSELFDAISDAYSDLIRKVRRQFQQIRPETLDIVPRVDTGDELDLPALIQSVVDRKTGGDPSDRIFSRKERKLRRVATLLLIDMSASTDEKIPVPHTSGVVGESQRTKRIIDIEIESLVVMTEALEVLEGEYAIFGFSGRGRHEVDFYSIKEFGDSYSENLKERIGGIEPKQSTRMGPAIRHATEKLRLNDADHRLLILLSDGFPQDMDYGEDRSSKEYGLNDTMMALIEARKEGIRPFCLTVDQAGNDYLRKMCDPGSYLVIKDIHSLPEILPKVVESLMV